MDEHQRIIDSLDNLSKVQKLLLLEMINYFQIKIKGEILENSDICTQAFAEDLENRLLLHHATNEDLLKKKAFEFAFKSASIADGKVAKIISSQTHRGADVLVNEVGFSLKTEASASLNPKKITISKLMEARWIRDCETKEDCVHNIHKKVSHHLNQYERILSLRGKNKNKRFAIYELVEIPLSLLQLCTQLEPANFENRTEGGSWSASVKINEDESFRITLDGSVEKVTIKNIPKEHCIIHGYWEIPLIIQQPNANTD